MVWLELASKARVIKGDPVTKLYRSIAKEVPRVLTIYDLDMPPREALAAIKSKFYTNASVKDDRVKEMLVEKAYMELEETLLQHKQRPHLIRLLGGGTAESRTGHTRKRLGPDATIDEQFARA